jgi:A/G-specific adenine glycosylase
LPLSSTPLVYAQVPYLSMAKMGYLLCEVNFDSTTTGSYTPAVANTDLTPRLAAFPELLLDWYADKQRDLPWRKTRDPYAVWVSEMMLQQTQVATVIPYWTRWMERFPTVVALAESPLDDVLKHWQGLGYYARARNLHRAAQVVVEKHDGSFPIVFDEVLALPGIGRYTAGAVCSIALGQDVPIVDANVIRVLCRVFGVPGDPKSPKVQERLWELATELIPSGQARDFNQGMMELGALVCGSKPRCGVCPVQAVCYGFEAGLQESLPAFAPKPAFTTQTDVSALIEHPSGDGRLLLIQRPPDGLWGGLWEFPRLTAEPDETRAQAAIRAAWEILGLAVRVRTEEPVATVRHGVTTRKITLVGVECVLEAGEPEARGCAAWAWVSLTDVDKYALSSPQVRLATQLKERMAQPSLF